MTNDGAAPQATESLAGDDEAAGAAGVDAAAADTNETAGEGADGTVEMRPLNDVQRKALIAGRIALRTYLLMIPFLILIGAGIDLLALGHTRAFNPNAGAALGVSVVMPAVLVILWTWYFADNRRDARRDLRDGTYACFTGPMKIVALIGRKSNGDTTTRYQLALGTFRRMDLGKSEADELRPRLPSTGQADVALRLGAILEIRDGAGATVFVGKGLRKAMGAAAALGVHHP